MITPRFAGEPPSIAWRAWCCFCRRYHIHGGELGHRVAHCVTPDGRAAFPHGYELRLDPRFRLQAREINRLFGGKDGA